MLQLPIVPFRLLMVRCPVSAARLVHRRRRASAKEVVALALICVWRGGSSIGVDLPTGVDLAGGADKSERHGLRQTTNKSEDMLPMITDSSTPVVARSSMR